MHGLLAEIHTAVNVVLAHAVGEGLGTVGAFGFVWIVKKLQNSVQNCLGAAVKAIRGKLTLPEDQAALAAVLKALQAHCANSQNLSQEAAAKIVAEEPALKPIQKQIAEAVQAVIDGVEAGANQ